MVIGQIGLIGLTVLNPAVEVFNNGIEPVTTHHLILVDNFVQMSPMMNKTAT